MDSERMEELLELLIEGADEPKEPQEVQKAVKKGLISKSASERGIIIIGNVERSNINTGDNFAFTSDPLTMRSYENYEPPEPPPQGELAEAHDFLPPGSRLPYLRNDVFTGRESDLLKLADSIIYDSKGEGCKAVVHGMGGIGKTELVVEFCYRYGRFFHGVHWLQGDRVGTSEDFAAEIIACGEKMDIQPWPEKSQAQVKATLQVWEQKVHEGERRLVILDNVDETGVIRKWLPKLTGVSVLITTRRENWPRSIGLKVHQLGVFNREESLVLLRGLAPRLTIDSNAELGAIAERLGDLPLAIHLAGLYMDDREELSVRNYLEELDRTGEALIHRSMMNWAEDSPTNQEKDLIATFMLSWERLNEDQPGNRIAKLIFIGSGYCVPNNPIPSLIFQAAFKEQDNTFDVDLGLRKLYNLGLMSRGEGGPSIHPLLAEFARLIYSERINAMMLMLIALAFESTSRRMFESGNQLKFLRYRIHMESVASAIETYDPPIAASLWNNIGVILRNSGDFVESKLFLERALKIRVESLGEKSMETVGSLNNLGIILADMGDYVNARAYLEKALRISQDTQGEINLDTARYLDSIGVLINIMGDPVTATSYIERALAIRLAILGKQHPDTAHSMSNLGDLLIEMGDLKKARIYIEQALKIRMEILGDHHPATAIDLNNLGSLLLKTGDSMGAKKYLEETLAIQHDITNDPHPDMAASLNNLGSILINSGDYKDAKKYLEQSLAIYEETVGHHHPGTASVLSNLGSLLYKKGELEEAKTYYIQALEIHREIFGEYHRNTATHLNNLGKLLEVMGNLTEAKVYYEKALGIQKEILGDHNIDTINSITNLGLLLKKMGELNEAKEYLEQVLVFQQETLGERHLDTVQLLSLIGFLLQEMRKFADAKPYLEQALQIRKEVLGEFHQDTAKSIDNLGHLFLAMYDFTNARLFFEQALKIRRKVLGNHHSDTANNLAYLGIAYYGLEQTNQAKDFLNESLHIYTEIKSPGVKFVREILENLKDS